MAKTKKTTRPTMKQLQQAADIDQYFTESKPKTKRNIIFEGHLAGVQYSDYQRVVGIRAGRSVSFAWERSNEHDPNAVRTMLDDVSIGYIPKGETWVFHRAHKAGQKIYGEIVSYNRSNPTWQMIVVRAWTNEEIPDDVAL